MDLVKVLKIENPSDGGTQYDRGPTKLNPNEDYVVAKGFALVDATTYISIIDFELAFTDTVTGTKKLSELLGSSSGNTVVYEEIFTATEDQTDFVLAHEPAGKEYIFLVIDAAVSAKDQFTLSTNTVVLNTALAGEEKVVIKYFVAGVLTANTDSNAIHTNVGAEIYGLVEKTSIHANDLILLEDSESSNIKKKAKISSITANAFHSNVSSEFSALTAKTTIHNNDLIVIEDSESTNAKKKITFSNLTAPCIHLATSAEISTLTEKTSIADNDLFIIEDSESSNAKKKVKLSNVLANAMSKHLICTANTGTGYTIDLANGTVFELTLDNATTFTFPSTGIAGELGEFWIYLKRDATGGRTITWDSDIKWAMDIVPSLDTTASTLTIFRFTQLGNSSRWYGEVLGMGYVI
jgi:hypothetical protein